MATAKQPTARFDTRISQEQKEFFERAAILGGFRNLTDFILKTVQASAQQIIEQNDKVIASERDAAIFFDAVSNPPKPNKALIEAAKAYKASIKK